MCYFHLFFEVDTPLTKRVRLIRLVLQARILPHLLIMQQEGVLGTIDIASSLEQGWTNSCSSIENKAPFPFQGTQETDIAVPSPREPGAGHDSSQVTINLL